MSLQVWIEEVWIGPWGWGYLQGHIADDWLHVTYMYTYIYIDLCIYSFIYMEYIGSPNLGLILGSDPESLGWIQSTRSCRSSEHRPIRFDAPRASKTLSKEYTSYIRRGPIVLEVWPFCGLLDGTCVSSVDILKPCALQLQHAVLAAS